MRFLWVLLIPVLYYPSDSLSRHTSSHSPRKAAWFSAAVPGLGQAYNRSWWKIPIIYAGMGSLAYFSVYNHQQYSLLRKYLIAETDNDPATINTTYLSASQLSQIKKQYKNRRDFCIAGTAFVYILQILEAHVDAHLKSFDVSDNLTIYFQPSFSNGSPGLMAVIQIKIH